MPEKSRSERNIQPKEPKEPEDRSLPILPVRDTVLFPHAVLPLTVGRESSVQLINSLGEDKTIVVVAQREARVDAPQASDLYTVGTLAVVHKVVKMPNQSLFVFAEGLERVRLAEFTQLTPFMRARVETVPESIPPKSSEVEALQRNVLTLFQRIVAGSPTLSDELSTVAMNIEEPGRLVDFIASSLPSLSTPDKQDTLETTDVRVRLEKVNQHLAKELEVQQLRNKIQSEVQDRVQQSQREYYLREQMKAIQKELGEQDEGQRDIEELRQKIESAGMPDEVKKEALKELGRLSRMSPMAADYGVTRNYIEWLAVLPWAKTSGGEVDIPKAKEILDTDHYDLQKVKDRILDYLSVRRLKPTMKGPILCFVGPPGVGKTSLGRSIARALARKFVRISLGGVHDEAEIRGHRRTYIGALPGKIIQSLKKAGSGNPVFLLDEVDKMSTDFRGDPSAALLEVLDPEQNSAFGDHYLDLDYDLSKVLFICTANTLHGIPPPLQDRLEIIRIAGYTDLEKLSIARKYLVAKQREQNGLEKIGIKFSRKALMELIHRYTKESGVRGLEREIATLCRKVAKDVLRNGGMDEKIRITTKKVHKLLGPPRFRYGKTEERDEIGLVTGLAWTEVGGELLQTEATVVPGKGKLILTGKLGDVMQESAQAAMSYVRSRAERFGLDKKFIEHVDIHVHVAEGAVPKDGPSAGVTMATAMVSALAKVPVRKDIAMTGEITLRGRVLPIGGLKEKALAAHRGGTKTIIIPKDNAKDVREIPMKIRRELKIIPVEHVDEVLRQALLLTDPDAFFKKPVDGEQPKVQPPIEAPGNAPHSAA